MAGEGDDRGGDGWMGITDSMDMSWSQAPGVGDGLGSLACCSPWHRKQSD